MKTVLDLVKIKSPYFNAMQIKELYGPPDEKPQVATLGTSKTVNTDLYILLITLCTQRLEQSEKSY